MDSYQPDKTARKARVITFEVRSQSYDLNVFVSPAEGEGAHAHRLDVPPKVPD